MAKFKHGDKIRMVEDKDYVVTVEKVTKNGYELSNRFKVYFKEESDWELEAPSEPSMQTKEESVEREIERKIEEYTTLGTCPHYDENASVCDDGDCGCAECISRIRRCEKQEAAKE